MPYTHAHLEIMHESGSCAPHGNERLQNHMHTFTASKVWNYKYFEQACQYVYTQEEQLILRFLGFYSNPRRLGKVSETKSWPQQKQESCRSTKSFEKQTCC